MWMLWVRNPHLHLSCRADASVGVRHPRRGGLYVRPFCFMLRFEKCDSSHQCPVLSESTPCSSPVSSAEIVAMSLLVSTKSKMSIFSAIRLGLDDLGIATKPSSMCQRSTT